jgi:tetratricopeptide (TPR) repeat protein
VKSLNVRSFIVFILFFGVIFAAQARAQSDSTGLKEFQEGLKLVQTEEYEKAITAFLATVQKDPKFADGWMMLGVTMFEVDLWDAATPCLTKAIELKPEIASIQEIRLLLPLIGARPFPPPASGSVSTAAQKKEISTDARLYFELGSGYALKGQSKKTIGAFAAAIKIDPDFADGWIGLGLALYDLGDQVSGLKCVMRGVSMKPELAEIPAVHLALAAKDSKASDPRIY